MATKNKRLHMAIGGDTLKRVRARVAGTGYREKDWVLAAIRLQLDREEGAEPTLERAEPEQKTIAAPAVADGSPGF